MTVSDPCKEIAALREESDRLKKSEKYAWENTKSIDKERMRLQSERDRLLTLAGRIYIFFIGPERTK